MNLIFGNQEPAGKETTKMLSRVLNRRKRCKLNVKQNFNTSKEPIKICTWNGRTMYIAGKINYEIVEIMRLRNDIMCISEMR